MEYRNNLNKEVNKNIGISLTKYYNLLKEGITPYETYHTTYSSAISAVIEYVKNAGYEVDDDEIYHKITIGPKKPSEGQTNKFILTLYKNGVEQRKALNFQVYGMNNSYELNAYIS